MEEDWVFKIWIALLLLKDSDFVVRSTPFQIAQRARKSEQQVLEALKILSSPDTKRIEKQAYDGRRIVAVEEGWLILNGDKYTALMKEEMKRAKNRRAQQAFRDRKKARVAKENGADSTARSPDEGQARQDEVLRRHVSEPKISLPSAETMLAAGKNKKAPCLHERTQQSGMGLVCSVCGDILIP